MNVTHSGGANASFQQQSFVEAFQHKIAGVAPPIH